MTDHPSAPDDLRAEAVEVAAVALWQAEYPTKRLDEWPHALGRARYRQAARAALAAALRVLAADGDREVERPRAEARRVDTELFDSMEELVRQRNEAREQLAARDQVIERLKTQRAEDERWVQGVLDAVREVADNMHDPLRGLSMSGGEVQDTLREILERAILADPGQWEAEDVCPCSTPGETHRSSLHREAEVKAAALREAADAMDREGGWDTPQHWLRARADEVQA